MAATELLSLSSITIRSESFLKIEKLLRSLHMWCDAPESITHFIAAAAAAAAAATAARAHAVSQKGSLSPVIARAAAAVAFFTFHHSFIRL